MNNKITIAGANLVFFIFVMLFLVFQIALLVASLFVGQEFIENNTYSFLLVNEYVLILIPSLVYLAVKRLNFRDVLRINPLGWKPASMIVLLSIPAYFTALMLNNIVVYLLQLVGEVPGQSIPVPGNWGELLVGVLIVGVSPALCEEVLNRGVLLRAYENRGSVKAVLFTAIIFGIFHFDVTNLLAPVFLGLLIGYYVLRTNSIFAGILAHFLNNTIAEFLQFFLKEGEPSEKAFVFSPAEFMYLIAGSIFGLLVVWALVRLFNRLEHWRSPLRPSISSIGKDVISIVTHWPITVVLALYVLLAALYIAGIANSGA
jgi:uncharacterized protein